MNNSEFYVTQENWPQPADEGCTLKPAEALAGTKKKQTKSTARVRKKLSESLAGVTAAAVAVVMLSTAIPALQDVPKWSPVQSGKTDTCTVCGKDDCPYFALGYPGLQLSLDSDTTVDEYDDHQTMQGYTDWNRRYIDIAFPCVETEDDRRCVLRVERDIFTHLNYYRAHSDGIGGHRFSDLPFSGEFFNLTDEKSSAEEFLYIAVSYDSTGHNRLVDPEIVLEYNSHVDLDPNARYNYITQKIPGVPNAQLQVVSSLSKDQLNDLLDFCSVEVKDAKDQTFDLGETMRFTESEVAYRTYADIEYVCITHYFDSFVAESRYNTHSLSFDTPSKDYSIDGNISIIFSDVGWPRLFDLACVLNENAPKTGHSVYFPTIELDRYVSNGITYRCYLFYHLRETSGDSYEIVCLMVPQQESEIAIRFEHILSAEEMTKLLASRDPEDTILPDALLSQITLR